MTLLTTTQPTRVWVNDLDVSAGLLPSALTTASPLTTSLIDTAGSITLAQNALPFDVLDLGGSIFPLGAKVIIACEFPGSGQVRHPAGLLFVMGSSVDIEARTITLEVGCTLALIKSRPEAYQGPLRSLFALTDPYVRAQVLLENYDLSELDALLRASNTVLWQTPYGSIWSIPIRESIEGGQPVNMASVDTLTALSVAPLGTTSAGVRPSRLVVRSSVSQVDPERAAPLVVAEGVTPLEQETTRETILTLNSSGGGGGGGGGSLSDSSTSSGSGQYTGVSNYRLRVFSGKRAKTQETNPLHRWWCGPDLGNRLDSAAKEEPVWAYAIEENSYDSVERNYSLTTRTQTSKFYGPDGQLYSESSVTSSSYREAAKPYLDAVAAKYEQLRSGYIQNAEALLGNVNTALSNRDAVPGATGAGVQPPSWYYWQCVASSMINEANYYLQLAQLMFRSFVNFSTTGTGNSAATSLTNTSYSYGAGGEVLRKITTTREPACRHPNNLAVVERFTDPTFGPPGSGSAVLIVRSTESVSYRYSQNRTTEYRDFVDYWDAANSVSEVRISSTQSSQAEQPDRLVSKAPPSATLQGPTFNPLAPGTPATPVEFLPPAVSECDLPMTQVPLEVVATLRTSSSSSVAADWIGTPARFDTEDSFPLQFAERPGQAVAGVCTIGEQSVAPLLQTMQGYADTRAALLAADERGYQVTETMRPELFNWRPFFRLLLKLTTAGREYVTVAGSTSWGISGSEAVAAIEALVVGENATAGPTVSPLASALPGQLEAPVAPGAAPPAVPAFFYGTPFPSLVSGPAPPPPDLVDDVGDPVTPPDVQGSGFLPVLAVAISLPLQIVPIVEMVVGLRNAATWAYGSWFGEGDGLPYDGGTWSAPNPAPYPFGSWSLPLDPEAV